MINSMNTFEKMMDAEILRIVEEGGDPIAKLDVRFAINEKLRLMNQQSGQDLNFDSAVKQAEKNYRNSLKAKTSEAQKIRIQKWNEWWFDYFAKISTSSLTVDKLIQHFISQHNSNANNPWEAMVMSEMNSHFGNGPEYFQSKRDHAEDQMYSYNYWYASGWPRILSFLNFAMLGSYIHKAFDMWVLMQNAFPSVSDYEASPESYYYMIDFMENIPFPTPELMDAAAKRACYYGKPEYTKDAIKYLEVVADRNMNEKSEWIYTLNPPSTNKYTVRGEYSETTYGMPKVNPNYTRAAEYLKVDNMATWYWPRPRDGYMYIPGWGYILPDKFMPNFVDPQQTPWGFAEEQRKEAEQARRRAKRKRGGSFVQKVARAAAKMNTKKGFWKGLGELAGNIIHELDPIYQINRIARQTPVLKDLHRELENLSGGLGAQLERVSDIPAKWIRGEPVTEQDLLEALDVGIKVVVIVASQGSATAIVGTVSSQLSRGSWGNDEVGKIFLAIGEIAAVAYASNTSFTKALGKYAERQTVALMKKEVYKANPDADIFGSFLIEMSVNGGFAYHRGAEWSNAFAGAAEKSALIAVGKQSPAAALAAMAFSEVKKNGIDHYIPNWDTVTDPEAWFDNFDWSKLGPNFVQMVREADKKDIKRLTGLTIMMAAGRINGETALGIIGQTIALRQIERFHTYQPVGPVRDKEMESFEKAFAQVQKSKNEVLLVNKIGAGHIPSVTEMETILDSGSANWITGKISAAINDPEAQNMLWLEQLKIGIPDWAKIGSIDMPEWAKVDKVDMPGWSKVTGQEEWNKKLQAGWKKFKDRLMSRDTLLKMFNGYLHSIWPPGTPLKVPGTDRYNYVNYEGFVEVRNALNFDYDHPMVKVGHVSKRYSQSQTQYMLAREMEVKQAQNRLSQIQRELEESGGIVEQLG